MIDEKNLIKDLMSVSISTDTSYGKGMKSAVDVAIDIVNKQPKIDDWIMASDRLPTKEEYQKNDGRFIVCDGNRVYQSLFDFYKNRFCFTRYVNPIKYELEEDKCVIKWKPLPEM